MKDQDIKEQDTVTVRKNILSKHDEGKRGGGYLP